MLCSFVIDAPGGGGKIPILPQYVIHKDEHSIVLRNYKNQIYAYHESKNGNGNGHINGNDVEKIDVEVNGKKNGSSKKPKNYKDVTSVSVPVVESNKN